MINKFFKSTLFSFIYGLTKTEKSYKIKNVVKTVVWPLGHFMRGYELYGTV